MFSSFGRSLSRSSQARNLLQVDVRLGTLAGAPRTNAAAFYSDGAEIGLGLIRGYVASAGAHSNGFVSSLSYFKSIAANPRLYRLFSSEAPKKKNYENFYPKEKKEIPKGEDKTNESEDHSNTNTDDHGNFQELLSKQLQNILTFTCVGATSCLFTWSS